MAVATYTKAGVKAATPAKLDKAVFGVLPKNHELLKAAYVAYLANGRATSAKVKTRGDVRGGGRKPWRQKGTGRARFGSSRNPIWRGGGITFGPTGEENYTHKLTVSAKRQALRQALSLAADNNQLIIMEDLVAKEPKTTEIARLLTKVGAKNNTLLIVANKTPELMRATDNIASVKLVQAGYTNVFDVLNADTVVVTKEAVSALSEWLKPVATAKEKEAAK